MDQEKNKEKKMFIGELVGMLFIFFGIIGLTYMLHSKEKYTITFDSMGGTYTTSARVLANKKIEKPSIPSKKGYIFSGWYDGDTEFDFQERITSDRTLVAHWKREDTDFENLPFGIALDGIRSLIKNENLME